LGRMLETPICDRLRAWSERYPDPLAPAERNTARAEEDERPNTFAGAGALGRNQVTKLIGWKFRSIPNVRHSR
jgi:hypothetical protein